MSSHHVGTSESQPASAFQPTAPVVIPSQSYPKSRRLLRPAEFRQVYDQGSKVPTTSFVAFCLRSPGQDGPKLGFTTPRALGKSTVRNRMRRRVRETFRRRLHLLPPQWRIVINLRRAALSAPQLQIDQDVEKVIGRCKP